MTHRQVAEPALLTRWPHDLVFLTLVILVGAGLLLCRLDDIYLWQDEAETALVGRHLLAFGLPLSTDGRDWVQQAGQAFVEFTSDHVWIYHSWLQYVLVAVSFAFLGPTTFAARLPFVVAGLAVLPLVYRLVLSWTQARRAAQMAAVLLLFCVPFLLLLRQSRYYALAAVFTLLTLDAYLWLQAGKSWALPYFVLSAVLLYHSHYGAFFPTLIALGIHGLVSRPVGGQARQFVAAVGLIALLVLPWAAFMRVLNRGQPFRLERFLALMGQYSLYTTGWIFPLALAALLVIAWLGRTRNGWPALTLAQSRFCQLVALVCATNFVLLSASAAFDWVFFRYMAHLIPLLLSVLALVVALIWERWPAVGLTLLVVLVGSNALGMLPYGLPGIRGWNVGDLWPASAPFQAMQDVWTKAGGFRSDLWMYAQELTQSYEGPNEGIIAYLSGHAQPGQSLAVNYEDLPLMFYTDLRVVGGLGLHGLNADSRPDWVANRVNGPYRDLLAGIVAGGSYERIELPYPDIRWENRPQPGIHSFVTVESAPPVVLYRRVGD